MSDNTPNNQENNAVVPYSVISAEWHSSETGKKYQLAEWQGKPDIVQPGTVVRVYESGTVLWYPEGGGQPKFLYQPRSYYWDEQAAVAANVRKAEIKQQAIERAIMQGHDSVDVGIEKLADALVRIINQAEGHASVRAFDTLMKHWQPARELSHNDARNIADLTITASGDALDRLLNAVQARRYSTDDPPE